MRKYHLLRIFASFWAFFIVFKGVIRLTDFTHFDQNGNAIMVDVSQKESTEREAVAIGKIRLSAACYDAVKAGRVQKGDVLGLARVAGIMAVKQTASLIPLCHTLPVEQAFVDFTLNGSKCEITAQCVVKTTGKTGVEMEALVGTTAALLTIYDMCKALDKEMVIGDVCLVKKTGGKSDYKREVTHER